MLHFLPDSGPVSCTFRPLLMFKCCTKSPKFSSLAPSVLARPYLAFLGRGACKNRAFASLCVWNDVCFSLNLAFDVHITCYVQCYAICRVFQHDSYFVNSKCSFTALLAPVIALQGWNLGRNKLQRQYISVSKHIKISIACAFGAREASSYVFSGVATRKKSFSTCKVDTNKVFTRV